MTSQQEECSLGSLISMSCRQRTEAFADRLRSRLTSLDAEDKNETANENSWLSSRQDAVALSQPKYSTDYNFSTNFYLNVVSPESPDDEVDEEERKFINRDNFISIKSKSGDDSLMQNMTGAQYDSDSSDGPFYDCQCDLNQPTDNPCRHIGKDSKRRNHEGEGSTTLNGEACSEKLFDATEKCNGDCHPEFDLNITKFDDTSTQDLPTHNNTPTETIESPIKSELTVPEDECKPSRDCFLNGTDDDTLPEERIPRVRKSASLKSGKTPPGTPGRKKIVRFADVLGLDLADVRTFLDEIPKIPNSAFNDLLDADFKSSQSSSDSFSSLKFDNSSVQSSLIPLFQQPGGQPDFVDRIRNNQVCLDSAVVEDPIALSIRGFVRVRNLDFHKSVHVRYTLNSWKSFVDVPAIYIENSCDGFSDKFTFLLYANHLPMGQKLEFAIRFQCKGCQYWDNNGGSNYCFQNLTTTDSSSAISSITDDSWITNSY